MNGQNAEEITRIIDAAASGDETAAERLLPLLYDELRHLAAARLAKIPPGQTLTPTAPRPRSVSARR